MNYISLLTEEETEIVCNLISGRGFKCLFQKNPKDFAKIKPGFRPNGVSETEAISVAIKNANKPFISTFINSYIQRWLTEIDEFFSGMISDGADEITAMAETLSNSYFENNFELYFKLAGENADDAYLAKLHQYISDHLNDTDTEIPDIQDEISGTSVITEGAHSHSTESSQQMNETYESQIQALKEAQEAAEQLLAEAQRNIRNLQSEKQEMEVELTDLRARAQYDDTADTAAVVSTPDFEYASLCEVTPPEYTGQVWLKRLADVNPNGSLGVFYVNEDLPKYFGNRDKLFWKDGPSDAGTIGVWNWTATPNNNDRTRDYVYTAFNHDIQPVEVIIVPDCTTARTLLQRLKSGVAAELTAQRTLFSAYVSKEQLVGFLCQKQNFEQEGNKIKLGSKVISLPRYELNKKDFTRLSNGKNYFRSISVGMPAEIVGVKNPLEIVQTVIMARSSWQSLKQQGKSRGEWKIIREFLEGLDTGNITADIANAANCSKPDAQKMLEDFKLHAENYIDGTTLEDGIVLHVIQANPDMLERCKALIMSDFVAENKASIDEANAVLAELKQKIEKAREQQDKDYTAAQEQIAKQKAAADEELAAVKREHATLQSAILALNADISAKEQFASEVESAVELRIRQAQNNAADFVAGLAFAPKVSITNIDKTEDAKTHGIHKPTEEAMCYASGVELNLDDSDELGTWKAALDTISSELVDAGVVSKHSRQLAAYMYAAYLNRCPLLLAGPNASAIADAFSGAIFGRTAGVLECIDNYSTASVRACYSSGDCVVKIINPFSTNWISRIPDIVSQSSQFFIAVYPYSEDIQIEPRSLYNYMLPVFTELFVDAIPTGHILGGYCTKAYKDFTLVKTSRSHNKLLTEMRTSALVKGRIQVLLSNMHAMLNDPNQDYDVLFALLPYAYATMQTPMILDAVRDGEKKSISISSSLLELINGLYGENE